MTRSLDESNGKQTCRIEFMIAAPEYVLIIVRGPSSKEIQKYARNFEQGMYEEGYDMDCPVYILPWCDTEVHAIGTGGAV